MPQATDPQTSHPAEEVVTEEHLGHLLAAFAGERGGDVALPNLTEPDDQPRVEIRSIEPLVPIEHERIVHLDSYRAAGWFNVEPGTWLRRAVADRVQQAATSLPEPWGLGVFDGWRSLALQTELYQHTYVDPATAPEGLAAGFLAEPCNDRAEPPPHTSGGSVDLTLTFEGTALQLGTDFDAFTDEAHTAAFETFDGMVRTLRRVLYWTMRAQGFVVLDQEWWHFEHGTRRWAAITDQRPCYDRADGPPAR